MRCFALQRLSSKTRPVNEAIIELPKLTVTAFIHAPVIKNTGGSNVTRTVVVSDVGVFLLSI